MTNELTEQQRLWFHAGESYARLAARTGADPVAMAEADVLGKLYDFVERVSSVNGSSGEVVERLLELWKQSDAALAACRQQEGSV